MPKKLLLIRNLEEEGWGQWFRHALWAEAAEGLHFVEVGTIIHQGAQCSCLSVGFYLLICFRDLYFTSSFYIFFKLSLSVPFFKYKFKLLQNGLIWNYSANVTVCDSVVGRSFLMCKSKNHLIKRKKSLWGLSIGIHRFNWHFHLRSDYFFLRQNSTADCLMF